MRHLIGNCKRAISFTLLLPSSASPLYLPSVPLLHSLAYSLSTYTLFVFLRCDCIFLCAPAPTHPYAFIPPYIGPYFPGLRDELIRPISSTPHRIPFAAVTLQNSNRQQSPLLPHNHPMKYSFFVSKYLRRQNRTDKSVSGKRVWHRFTPTWFTHTHLLPVAHAHIHGAVPSVPTEA